MHQTPASQQWPHLMAPILHLHSPSFILGIEQSRFGSQSQICRRCRAPAATARAATSLLADSRKPSLFAM